VFVSWEVENFNAGTKSLWVDISNNGFLKTGYTVEIQDTESTYIVRQSEKEVTGYAASRFYIDLCPTYTHDWRPPKDEDGNGSFTRKGKKVSAAFTVTFADNSIKPIQILCEGIALDPPLFADRSIMDFSQCLVETTYHDQLYIHNLHNSSLRFWMDFAPHKMTPHEGTFQVIVPQLGTLNLSTSFGFVQPCQALPVWFTLTLLPESYAAHMNGDKPFKLPFTINYIETQSKSERSVPILLTG
jgi:hypothetical protein